MIRGEGVETYRTYVGIGSIALYYLTYYVAIAAVRPDGFVCVYDS